MSNELNVIETTFLTDEEKTELDRNLERIIAEHKKNKQEINRLVFESISTMTEADESESVLSNKGFLKRLIGGITGSNQKLQNKINANRAIAQYASQQTLQKLAEQNLMSFDLITAVNNKLNASINSVNEEFKNIYSGLSKFLKHNRNELARIETRLAKVEQNVNLLTWQNSIEYQEFDGEEYADMENTTKIVCLVRDFYEITNGNWSTSDLLLLKTAMSTIGISPKEIVNYYAVLREISQNQQLRNKLIGNADIHPIDDPSYLISMGILEKLDALEHRESYIVDSVIDTVVNDTNQDNIHINRNKICDSLTKNYLKSKAMVNVDVNVESYDLILDLLYNIKQAESEKLLRPLPSEQDVLLKEAEQLFLHCKMEESLEKFETLAENGNSKAMYFLGELYCWALPKQKQDQRTADKWRKKGAELNDTLCRLNLAYCTDINEEDKKNIISSVMDELINLAKSGDMYAQNELGSINDDKNNEAVAIKWYKLSAEQGYFESMNNLANIYDNKGDYTEANKWYQLAGEVGYDWGWKNLADNYNYGYGVSKDKYKAVDLYKKAFEMSGNAAGTSANRIGSIYYSKSDYTEANKWYQLAGEAGYDDGWNSLAANYQYGNGVSEDKDKALALYKRAYEMDGDNAGESANSIGVIYATKGDYAEANKWYQLAGEAGYDLGWYNLADSYQNGYGVSEDEDKALELYKKAFEMDGDVAGKSANRIGEIYFSKSDHTEANKWYQLAGEAGYDWGWYNLASYYFLEEGVSEDKDKTLELYKKAFELNGDAADRSAYFIGETYYQYNDDKKAKKWFQIASKAGSSEAREALEYYNL